MNLGGQERVDEDCREGLVEDVASEGRECNAVLVWNYSRLSRNAAELAEVKLTLREQGIDLVSVADGSHFAAFER